MPHWPLDRPPRPLVVACIAFLLAGAAATAMIRRGEQHNRQEVRARVSNLAGDHADALQRNVERALSATYAIAALVRQGNGTIADFDTVGRQMLPFFPGVSSLSLAPGGVIASVVPLAGNEKAIGQNLLTNPETQREASIARESGRIALAGPLTLVQGEIAVIGRLPIFLDDAKGTPSFWGFVNAVVRFPDAIEAAGLTQLAQRGIAYELWRIHPDTGQKQIISASTSATLIDPVDHNLVLPSGNWTLSAAPVAGWGDPAGLLLKAALGALFSLLLAYLAKLLVESKAHEQGLEALVVQRTAEVAARETDLNRAQSVARVGSWVFDFTTNEFHGSTEALRIFGMSGGGAFSFDTFLEHVHPQDRVLVDRAWRAAGNGEPYDIEYRITIDATIRWVHSYAESTSAADGTQRRALGTVQDVTERKRREEDLRNFRAAMDASADAIYLVDRASMRFVDVNEAACRMQSRTHEELLALGPDGVLSMPRAELERIYDSIIAGGPGGEPLEMLRRRRDGRQVWVELRRRAQRSADGWMIVTTVRDITERKIAESALRENETRFRLTFELAGSGIAHIDMDGRFLRVNRSLCAMLGFSEKELLGRTVKELSHPDDRDKTDAARARVLSGERESMRFQKRYLRKDGATLWVDVTVALVRDAEGKSLYEIAIFDDHTERMHAEHALRESAMQLRLFADNVPAMTTSFDENLRLTFVNRRYAEFFGYGSTDILGKHLREIVGERVYGEIEGYFGRVLQGHPVTYERARKLPDGASRYLEIKLLPHIGEQGKVLGCFAVTTDITDHKLAEERIQRVAHHDSLTGLPNRLLFNDRLGQAINLAKRDARQFALLYLDLDKFKPVNDTLGHAAGDELLQGVAARIQQQVRKSDTLARLGGDEFALILPGISKPEEAETVARKIIDALAAPFQLGSQKHSVGIGTSIGIALYPADAQYADALIKAADTAMYSAKQMGSSFRFAAWVERTNAA